MAGCRRKTCTRKHRLLASTFKRSRGASKESITQQHILMFSTLTLKHKWPVLPSFCSATTGGPAANDNSYRFRSNHAFAQASLMGCPDILLNKILDMLEQHSAGRRLQGGVPGENTAVISVPARPGALHTLRLSGWGSSRSCQACAEHRQGSDGSCLCPRLPTLAAHKEANPGRATGVPNSLFNPKIV